MAAVMKAMSASVGIKSSRNSSNNVNAQDDANTEGGRLSLSLSRSSSRLNPPNPAYVFGSPHGILINANRPSPPTSPPSAMGPASPSRSSSATSLNLPSPTVGSSSDCTSARLGGKENGSGSIADARRSSLSSSTGGHPGNNQTNQIDEGDQFPQRGRSLISRASSSADQVPTLASSSSFASRTSLSSTSATASSTGGGTTATTAATTTTGKSGTKIRFAPLPEIRTRSYSTGRNVWLEDADADSSEPRAWVLRGNSEQLQQQQQQQRLNSPARFSNEQAVPDTDEDDDEYGLGAGSTTPMKIGSPATTTSHFGSLGSGGGIWGSWKSSDPSGSGGTSGMSSSATDTTAKLLKPLTFGLGGGSKNKKNKQGRRMSTGANEGARDSSWSRISSGFETGLSRTTSNTTDNSSSNPTEGIRTTKIPMRKSRTWEIGEMDPPSPAVSRRAQYPPVAQRSRNRAPLPTSVSAPEPSFVEWGGISARRKPFTALPGGGGSIDREDEDDGSGLSWVNKRKAQREAEARKKKAKEEEEEKLMQEKAAREQDAEIAAAAAGATNAEERDVENEDEDEDEHSIEPEGMDDCDDGIVGADTSLEPDEGDTALPTTTATTSNGATIGSMSRSNAPGPNIGGASTPNRQVGRSPEPGRTNPTHGATTSPDHRTSGEFPTTRPRLSESTSAPPVAAASNVTAATSRKGSSAPEDDEDDEDEEDEDEDRDEDDDEDESDLDEEELAQEEALSARARASTVAGGAERYSSADHKTQILKVEGQTSGEGGSRGSPLISPARPVSPSPKTLSKNF